MRRALIASLGALAPLAAGPIVRVPLLRRKILGEALFGLHPPRN